MTQAGPKKIKKGEILFNENDPITSLLLIQTGRIKFFLPRAKGIDIQTFNAPMVIGELGLFSATKYPYSIMAVTELSVIEFPIEAARQSIEAGPAFLKSLTRSMVELSKSLGMELKGHKLDLDSSPCPPEIIPRLFGGVYHTIKHVGTLLPDQRTEVDWGQMKRYTFRIFNLSQDKIEAVNNLMAKFGQVEFKYEKLDEDPNGPEQLTKIFYKDYQLLESFFEFYQYYFFKAGKQDILKYDESIFNIVRGLLAVSKENPPDKTGLVKTNLNSVLDYLKNEFSLKVTASHWQVLENKGLFSKRAQGSDGQFFISYHFDDFQKTFLSWRFLREISQWNNTGSINPAEPEFPKIVANAKSSDGECPECKAPTTNQQKFCSECGCKINMEKAGSTIF